MYGNSHGSEAYQRFAVQLGGFRVDEELRYFVDEWLIAAFLFVVGPEVKRDVLRG